MTSGSGSVIKDILNVLSRRFPNFNLILNPVAVQGSGSEKEIAQAIKDFNIHKLVDVIIVGRGGGSLEDLFSFNERIVADAIYKSDIPIISACGHETDFTIADFVADVRAPTPSAAAELVVVEKSIIHQNLLKIRKAINQILFSKIKFFRGELEKIKRSRYLESPYSLLSIFIQNIDTIDDSINKTVKRFIREKKHLLEHKKKTFHLCLPLKKFQLLREKIKGLGGHLSSVNPRNILKKGYSIIYEKKSKKIISSYKQIQKDDSITIQLGIGVASAKIEHIKEN